MTCAEARSLLSCHLDGELSPTATERLAAHLHRCASCTFVRRAMEEQNRVLSEHWPAVPAPAGFSSRVAVALTPRRPANAVGRLVRSWVPALAGALAVLLVVAGVAIPPVRAGITTLLEIVSLRETRDPPIERRLGNATLVSLDEAQGRVSWRIRTPSALPEGYQLAGVIAEEIYRFADGASVALYYVRGDSAEAPQLRIVQTRVQPGVRADLPVEPGTSSQVGVSGRNAILIDGEWQVHDGQMRWVRGTLLRLIVEDGDLLISLEVDPRDGWDAAGLIRVAESLR